MNSKAEIYQRAPVAEMLIYLLHSVTVGYRQVISKRKIQVLVACISRSTPMNYF